MASRQIRTGDYLHLFNIYVVWATGYLGMKLGVEGPDALTVYQLQGSRLLLGGALLLAFARARGPLAMPSAQGWLICLVSAFLFWICGNGFAFMALRELPSGFVAMAMGTIPLWSAVLNAVRTRRAPAQPATLAIGFCGIALIYLPTLSPSGAFDASWATVAMLFFAPIAWNVATMLQPPLRREMDGTAAAGTQLILGGLMACLLALVAGVPIPSQPSFQTIAAGIFLAVFASAICFQSYVSATALFPPNVVAAFAYVNPPVGVLLGWALLGETPSPISLLGMTIVIGAVLLTLRQAGPASRHSPASSQGGIDDTVVPRGL